MRTRRGLALIALVTVLTGMGGMDVPSQGGRGIGLANVGTLGRGASGVTVRLNRCDAFDVDSDDVPNIRTTSASFLHAARTCTVGSDNMPTSAVFDVTLWTMNENVTAVTATGNADLMRCLRPALRSTTFVGTSNGRHNLTFSYQRKEALLDFTDQSTHLTTIEATFPARTTPTCTSFRRTLLEDEK